MPWVANQATARLEERDAVVRCSRCRRTRCRRAGSRRRWRCGCGCSHPAVVDCRLVSALRPSFLCPPPSGTRASFLTSMWTSSPRRGRLDPSDHPARRPVHPTQPVHAMTDQHPMHRRGRDTNDARQSGRTEPARLAQRHDPALNPSWGLMRTRQRSSWTGPAARRRPRRDSGATTCGRTGGRCSSTPPPPRPSSRPRSGDRAGAGPRA